MRNLKLIVLIVLGLLGAGLGWYASRGPATRPQTVSLSLWRTMGGWGKITLLISAQESGGYRYNASLNRQKFCEGQVESLAIEGLVANLVALGLEQPRPTGRPRELVQVSLSTNTGQAMSCEWAAEDRQAVSAVKLFRRIPAFDAALGEGVYRLGPPLAGESTAWPQTPFSPHWRAVIDDLQESIRQNQNYKFTPLLATHPELLQWTSEDGSQLIHLAAREAEAETIRALVRLGASLTARDKQGKTARDYLLARNRPELDDVLLEFDPPELPPLTTCGERLAIEQFDQQVKELVLAEKFAQLEAMAQKLLKTRAVFPDGRPKLEIFYKWAGGRVDEESWETALARHRHWLAAYPRSRTARVAHGLLSIDYAWEARGGGYANTVTREGWRLFGERLKTAEKVLTAVDEDPFACCGLITVAMANGWERARMESLLKRARRAFPGCTLALDNAAYYLTPRWQGEAGELEDFARTWSQHNPVDYSVVWDAVRWLSSEDGLQFEWPRLKASYQARLRKSPSAVVKNRFARAAVTFGDQATAERLVREIGAKWDPNSWDEDERQYNRLRARAARHP